MYKQNNQNVHRCIKIHLSLLFHHLLFSNTQILLLILRYEEVQNITWQDKHICITNVYHTDFVTNSIDKLDIVFLYILHIEYHSNYHYMNYFILILAHNRNTSLLFNPHVYTHKTLPQCNPSLAFSI